MAHTLTDRATAALGKQRFAEARHLMVTARAVGGFGYREFLLLGLAELALGNWSAASATLTEAVCAHPEQPRLWLNLGYAQENLGEITAAAESYRRCLKFAPDQAEAWGNLSHLCCRLGRAAEAETCARQALSCGAAPAQALNALALALKHQGRFADADAAFAQALDADSGDAAIHANWANAAVDRLDFAAAWPRFAAARALDDNPTLKRDEGMARLLAGDYRRGWPLWENRLALPGALRIPPPCPRHQSEPLSGKRLLVIAEQGFGDTLHFCRFTEPLAAATGADIALVVQKPLVRLLTASLSIQIHSENDPPPSADYHLPLLSLPLALDAQLPTEWPPPPCLRVPHTPRLTSRQDARSRDAGQHTGTARKIGLVWAGSPGHRRDRERSISLAMLAPLWHHVSAHWFAPFTGAALDEIGDAPIRRLDSLIFDFADTAALLRQLDALVTVDTSVAHLAGALGLPTWLLLPYCPDWRWTAHGETTPWYPSLTILRQAADADWRPVISRLVKLLCDADACPDP